MTLAEYEKTRPVGEQKIKTSIAVIRVNVDYDSKEVKILVHEVDKDGCEILPLGYMLGSNSLIYNMSQTELESKPVDNPFGLHKREEL